jgi:DNA gyrase/topoisomerase IV subunit B
MYLQLDGDGMGMECVFLYDPENKLVNQNSGSLILSYANFCTTISDGTHVEGFKNGLSSFMTKYVRENCMNKKELNEMNITGDDTRNGLVAIVNVYLENASFVG